jgi:hypothetical protein
MGAAARKWVLEHYTNDRVLGLLTSYYKGMLEKSPREPGGYRVKVAEAAQ